MRRVLLVDDDPAVIGLLSELLGGERLEVVACREIEAAWAVLRYYVFGMVVTDLCLSELGGLEGVRLVRHVRKEFPSAIVAVASGYVTHDVRLMIEHLGCHLVPKPVDFDALAALVRAVPETGASGNPPEPGRILTVDLLDDFLASGTMRSALQPIVSTQAGGPPFRGHGVEGLARPLEGGVLKNPEILFAYAFEKQRVFDTDRICIQAALREKQRLPHPGRLFLNVHPRSLIHPEFESVLVAALAEAGMRGNQVILELTEQQTILDLQAFSKTIDALRRQGFKVALDDFGSGYSNLHLMRTLRPDYLKLSGHLCRGLAGDAYARETVRSVVGMAHRLGIPTVLENVETEEEFEAARSLGVTYAQGYYVARPGPAEDLARSGLLAEEDTE